MDKATAVYVGTGAAVVTAVVVVGVPATVGLLGFKSGGIAIGSTGAKLMSV